MKRLNPLTKSLIITFTGYILGVIGQLVVYPYYGIIISLPIALELGIIFTTIAFISNILSVYIIEAIEKYKISK